MPRFQFDAKRYPAQPGCYLFRDATGEVIYVGKAKNLRRRLASYFRPRGRDWKARRLAVRAADIEVILVDNEVEALVLENNLIKRHKPPFNLKLVDDDTGYFYIVLTGGEVPRLAPYRKKRMNRSLGEDMVEQLFGPYISRHFRDVLLQYACETFGIRTCASMSGQVCLRYHLGWCSGVCEQKVPADEYAHAVERAAALLSHPHDDLILEMKGRMWACAERLEFERAQHIRDQIQALESALERQVVERKVGHDQDVIYFGEHKALVTRVRRGVVQGMHLCDLDATDGYDKACADFLLAHYANGSPRELIVNRLSHLQEVERALALANQCPVQITLPQRGAKRELLRLCEQNYDYRVSIQDAGCRVQDAG